MNYALSNHEELDNWFTEIKKWDRYDRCSTRKVWLEVIGVPPHGWSWETFNKIAEIWGVLISLGKSILRTDTFASMKLLIETDILSNIERSLILQIEELGYRVHVKEVSSIMSATMETKQNKVQLEEEEDVESNQEIPGFDDVDVQKESTNAEVKGKQVNQEDQLVNHHHTEDDRSSSKSNSNSNSNAEGVNQETILEGQEEDINSDTRTKTALLLNNECSEDVIMNVKKAAALRKGERSLMINDEQAKGEDDSVQVPPGFGPAEMTLSSRPSKKAMKCDYRTQRMCRENNQRTTLDNGDNNQVSEGRRPTQLPKDGNQKGNLSSQSNVRKEKEQPPAECASGTWDSCERLANEALHIGEILGIKVIKNKQAAIEEIAKSIGKKKKQKTVPRQFTSQANKATQN